MYELFFLRKSSGTMWLVAWPIHSSAPALESRVCIICEVLAHVRAVFIGLSMGACAFAVDILLETLNTWKFNATREAIKAGEGFWRPYSVFMAFCLGYSGLSGALVAFGAPLAAGSGIPEIKTYLNGVHIRGEPPAHPPARPPTHSTLASQALQRRRTSIENRRVWGTNIISDAAC